MSNFIKLIAALLITVVLFAPFYSETLVPEWELVFVDKKNSPVPHIRVNQVWKNYSSEYSNSKTYMHNDIGSDSNGYLKLPAREIGISVFQLVVARIGNAFVSGNPPAGSGTHSYIVCLDDYKCVAHYREESEQPQTVVVVQ